ncbi:hypothetical protein EDE08_11735 [Bradyrhizobium sp. R2.2-H]|nr:hypothetical protein EDE10_117111 [Bradyrhizobium sp. Y-H1]TCU65852.1 hypothetical protein EDE08_11735 [Bradyrhizobium sp. R2.2-H]
MHFCTSGSRISGRSRAAVKVARENHNPMEPHGTIARRNDDFLKI